MLEPRGVWEIPFAPPQYRVVHAPMSSSMHQSSNICRYWAATGNCYYGDQCNYAHSYPNGRAVEAPAGHMPKSQRPCRNVEIYGYCKYVGKGCEFNHDMMNMTSGQGGGFSPTASTGLLHMHSQPSGTQTQIQQSHQGSPPGSGVGENNQPATAPEQGFKENSATEAQGPRKDMNTNTNAGTQGPETSSSLVSSSQSGAPKPTNTDTAAASTDPRRQQTQPQPHSQSAPQLHNNGALHAQSSKPAPLREAAPPFRMFQPGQLPPHSQQQGSIAMSQQPMQRLQGVGMHSSNQSASYAPSTIMKNPLKSKAPEDQDYAPMRMYKKTQPMQSYPPRAPSTVTHGGTTYFYDPASMPAQYPGGQPPHPSTINRSGPVRRGSQTFFMSESLRQDFIKKNQIIYAQLDPEDERAKMVPATIGNYHSVYPLDNPSKDKNHKIFGYPTSVFKAINPTDGMPYALRRIEGFRLTNKFAAGAVEIWKQLQHPNLVNLREIFLGNDLEDLNSVYFVYDFHAGAETLEMRHLQGLGGYLPEGVLWSYFTQVASGLRAIHAAGLACRVVDPSKILFTGKNRLRLNCVGILDVISPDSVKDVEHFQCEDLVALGKLFLSLACRSTAALGNLSESLDFLGMNYSPELKNIVVSLLRQPSSPNYPNIDQICSLLTNQLLLEHENALSYADTLESELGKEIENGRLLRLMVKLGFINERPEYENDPGWAETGDHYMLKLFRDHVFHQAHENGAPAVDFAHVVDCLNKLDIGSDERVLLMSRDEASIFVVSYKELKRSMDGTFRQLFRKQPPPQSQPQGYNHSLNHPHAAGHMNRAARGPPLQTFSSHPHAHSHPHPHPAFAAAHMGS